MRELRNHSSMQGASGSTNVSSKHRKHGQSAGAPSHHLSSKKRQHAESHEDSTPASKKKKVPALTAQTKHQHKGPAAKPRRQPQSLARASSSKFQKQAKKSATSQQVYQEDEEEDEDDEDEEGSRIQPGEDEEDYEGVDLLNAFERAQWQDTHSNGREMGNKKSVALAQQSLPEDEEMEISTDGADGRSSSLTERQRKRQADEQLLWLNHRRSSSTISVHTSGQTPSDNEKASASSEDSSDEPSSYNGDPDSIGIVIPRGSRYPLLKLQSPRVARVVRRAFLVSEYRIAFRTPYPPLDDLAHYFRDILRTGARELNDDELAQRIKTSATYGNTLAYLVKPRFTQYRREIRLHAKAEAKAAYRLNPGPDCGERVQGLLLDDTFVYGVDNRGLVKDTEPYRHPAIISMIQFFFKDSRAVGQSRSSSFKSSIPEERNATLSEEKELPIPMLAFSATMLRAELLLWKFGTRQSIKFDADQHSTTYDHHVSALEELKQRFPVKFHRLMHFLYAQGGSTSLSVSDGCDGRGVLGKLGWQDDSE